MRHTRFVLAMMSSLIALGGSSAVSVGGDAPRWATIRRASRPVAVAPTSIRAVRPTLVLWRHQYDDDDKHVGPDPTRPNSAGKMIEIVETGEDGAPVGRRWWRHAYPYQEVFPRPLRSEALTWDGAEKRLWVFACTSLQSEAHIDAFEVESPTASTESTGRVPDRLDAWVAATAPTSRYVLKPPDVPREWQIDQIRVVPDRTGFTIALFGPHTDGSRWIRFQPDHGWSELLSGPLSAADPKK